MGKGRGYSALAVRGVGRHHCPRVAAHKDNVMIKQNAYRLDLRAVASQTVRPDEARGSPVGHVCHNQ